MVKKTPLFIALNKMRILLTHNNQHYHNDKIFNIYEQLKIL